MTQKRKLVPDDEDNKPEKSLKVYDEIQIYIDKKDQEGSPTKAPIQEPQIIIDIVSNNINNKNEKEILEEEKMDADLLKLTTTTTKTSKTIKEIEEIEVEEGTADNPLSLSSDEEDDENSNNNNNNHNNGDVSEVSLIEVDENNIFLTVKIFQVGHFPEVNLNEIHLKFLDTEMEIRVPQSAFYPNSRGLKSNFIQISVSYKNISRFFIQYFKTNMAITCTCKEYNLTKAWLSKPKPMKNHELGFPSDLIFKNISKEQFLKIKPYIEEKSSCLKLSMEIEEQKKDRVIAIYPHVATSLIKETHKNSLCNNDSNNNSSNNISNLKNGNFFSRDIVKITSLDLSRLEPKQYLNDSIVDFYMRYIRDHYIKDDDKKRIYFFNTFFYNILTFQSTNDAYPRISKWTKDQDIFSYDFLFIPICENFHWTLCIICFPAQEFNTSTPSNRPTFLFLDSLQTTRTSQMSIKIRQYLSLEWYHKKVLPSEGKVLERQFTAKNLVYHRAKVPKQDNLCDCGVFLLHYAELFCRNPEKDFNEPLHKPKWFPLSDIVDKREIIKSIIKRLQIEQQDEDIESITEKINQEKLALEEILSQNRKSIEIDENKSIEDDKEKIKDDTKEENIEENVNGEKQETLENENKEESIINQETLETEKEPKSENKESKDSEQLNNVNTENNQEIMQVENTTNIKETELPLSYDEKKEKIDPFLMLEE